MKKILKTVAKLLGGVVLLLALVIIMSKPPALLGRQPKFDNSRRMEEPPR
jgi:hypothetical protein